MAKNKQQSTNMTEMIDIMFFTLSID